MSKYPYRVMSVYGARESEPTLEGGFRALGTGETSGHITSDEYFTDPALYEKYIKGTGIPCRIFNDLQTGETVYQVHFSWGPARSDPLHPGSVLDADEFVNGMNAHLLTRSDPMSLIEQHSNNVQSPIDVLGVTRRSILLNSQSMIRFTPENAAAVQIFQKNIQHALADFLKSKHDEGKDRSMAKYQSTVKKEFEKLHQAIAPESTADQFAHDFHNIGTIGIEPTETRKLNLITKADQQQGKVGSRIDLRLAKIRKIYDVMHDENYNFLLDNCAHKVAEIERAGLSECDDPELQEAFNHTPGYNEFEQFGFSPQGLGGVILAAEPFLGRRLESPVNLLHMDREYNQLVLEKSLENQQMNAQSPAPQLPPKLSNVPELEPRPLKRPRPEDHHGALYLKMSRDRGPSLDDLVNQAEEGKFVVQVSKNEKTSLLSIALYNNDKEKLPIARVEFNPASPNSTSIKFDNLPLDDKQTQTEALLRLLSKTINDHLKHSDAKPNKFTIGFSDPSVAIQADVLKAAVRRVFGANTQITIEQEATARHHVGPSRN